MSRDVPFDREAICDECGKKGAYDFMGDFFCPECTQKLIVTEPEYTTAIYYDVMFTSLIPCDICGEKGSYDFEGEHVCEECALKDPKYDKYKEDEE